MKAFSAIDAAVLPLDRSNVDTDAIIPKQYLKSIERTGFGVNLFDDWRYLDVGEPGQDCRQRRINPDFVLNRPQYKDAKILLARDSGDAGFEWRNPGCSMCLAMNADRLKPGERCLSTSNRNFEGRQGQGGRTHLLSPAMAAAASIAGHVVDMRSLEVQ